MDIGTVSSDDVITSYRNQLSEAHHQIAVLQAQIAKATKIIMEQQGKLQEGADRSAGVPDIPIGGDR